MRILAILDESGVDLRFCWIRVMADYTGPIVGFVVCWLIYLPGEIRKISMFWLKNLVWNYEN